MRRFFVTGTGTEVGKTFITAAMCYQVTQAGYRASAIKPLISGYDETDANNDCAVLLRSLEQKADTHAQHAMAPWRFQAPLSPHMAAWEEGAAPNLKEVVTFAEKCGDADDYLFLEGAGGLMVPINDEVTYLDLSKALGWEVILVAGSYLGAISHTLTALEVLHTHKLNIAAVVINESEGSTVSLEDTLKSIQLFSGKEIPVYSIARVGAGPDPWKECANLEGIWRR